MQWNPIFENQLREFCDAVNAKVAAYYVAQGFNKMTPPKHTFTIGQRWAKVWVMNEQGQKASIFCFVDPTNGNIFKAAGINAPAKHARGNIANRANDVTPHGAVYR